MLTFGAAKFFLLEGNKAQVSELGLGAGEGKLQSAVSGTSLRKWVPF